MFRQLPKNSTLDELWRAGLVYSRPISQTMWDGDGWTLDEVKPGKVAPTADSSKWQYAIQVED